MRFAGLIVGLIVGLMCCAGAAVAGPFDGLYRDKGFASASCDPDMLGSDGGPMQIRDGVLTYVESACQLVNPVTVRGMNATLFDLQCAGEGETYTYRVMLMNSREGLVSVRQDSIRTFERCD